MDKYTIAPPAGSTNNSVGAEDRPWQEGHFNSVKLNGGDLGEYLAESTGYGIVSGCEPTISGLTVTVGAGIVHLADGTRKELSVTNITLDAADSTNPRIDLVYINADGAVAKVTGTAAASPSVPALPTAGISVAQVSVAANATTGTITDMRGMLARWYNSGVVNVRDFGAVGDGVTDDTVAIQAAVNAGNVVLFSADTFFVTSPITLHSNLILSMNGAKMKAKAEEQPVRHSNTFFVGNNISDIYIENGIFDNNTGHRTSQLAPSIDYCHNALKFTGCSKIKIKNCDFTNFVSPTYTSNDAWSVGYWSNIFFHQCKHILMEKCTLTDSAIEGWSAFDCENVVFDTIYTKNKYMSTPLNVFYCKNATLVNSTILEDVNREDGNKGSTVNWYCKDSEMRGNYFEGGTGIDIGNEEDGYPGFIQENLIISDNIIKTKIYCSGFNPSQEHLENVKIHHNTIKYSNHACVTLGDCNNIDISNNTIINDEVGISFGQNNCNVSNICISSNVFRTSMMGIIIQACSGNYMKDFDIFDNNFISGEYQSPTQLTGSFLIIRDGSNVNTSQIIDNINVHANNVKCYNSCVAVLSTVDVGEICIEKNNIDGVNSNLFRAIYIVTKVNKIILRDNLIHNYNANSISFTKANIFVCKNNIFVIEVIPTSLSAMMVLSSVDECNVMIIKENVTNIHNNNLAMVKLMNDTAMNSIDVLDVSYNYPDVYINNQPTTYGSTTHRRSASKLPKGYVYYDTTLEKPIFTNGTNYVDSTGNVV